MCSAARWHAQDITKLDQDKVACFIDRHPALHVALRLVEHLQGATFRFNIPD